LAGHETVYRIIESEGECNFIDPVCHGEFFLRNCAMSEGHCRFVVEIGSRCFEQVDVVRLVISRNVELIGESCFSLAAIRFLATENGSHLHFFGTDAFAFVRKLSFLCIPDHFALSWSSPYRDRQSPEVDSFHGLFRLSAFSPRMFSGSSSLMLVWIPSSVTTLGESCFSDCESLSTLIFEPNSNLSRIEARAF
jgi:hypothetical protein